MFEMKNENDEKQQRRRKTNTSLKSWIKTVTRSNVNMRFLWVFLEADNELYNTGIVDVSHQYPKMYVVRPQFFIPIITLLRNAALNSLQYKQELALMRDQHIDITHFEEDLETFKKGFARNYELASKKFKRPLMKSIRRLRALRRPKRYCFLLKIIYA